MATNSKTKRYKNLYNQKEVLLFGVEPLFGYIIHVSKDEKYRLELRHMKKEVPIWEKSNLTIEEAAAYFNIGENKLRKLAADENCPFVLWVGSKCLIKKACFEEYLRKRYSI